MSDDPFAIESPESKLLQQIHALGVGKFNARDIHKRLQRELKQYFGRHREVNAISAGILLKRLLAEQSGDLKLEGEYQEVRKLQLRGKRDKSLRVWSFRVVPVAAPVFPREPQPGHFDSIARKSEPDVPPMVVPVQQRVDSLAETHSQNPLNPFSDMPAGVSKGIWERTGDHWQRVGDHVIDGAAGFGYPSGNLQEAMAETALLAGAAPQVRVKTWHERQCDILGCDYDTFA
jgi:hypothetical protein